MLVISIHNPQYLLSIYIIVRSQREIDEIFQKFYEIEFTELEVSEGTNKYLTRSLGKINDANFLLQSFSETF